jgi:hypothetical protein
VAIVGDFYLVLMLRGRKRPQCEHHGVQELAVAAFAKAIQRDDVRAASVMEITRCPFTAKHVARPLRYHEPLTTKARHRPASG